ncbi:ribosomal maturation YjgA family protein [Flavobacterium luminosum]|uniref:ribosomal maturation YjgA family protein n=1 Tax=Flavobacterium luminosum TaxID=2949086 RepID=UPI0038CBF42D
MSRQFEFIPLFFGDILYASMVYFIVCLLFPKTKSLTILGISLVICYLIEIQQICDLSWLVTFRGTTIGHYLLGEGFLWSDLIYYTIGSSLSFIIHQNNFFSK